ncbi:zinc finger protein 462-like isoform X14 [Haliotis rubra]|uniref:zinc finger protein 462-like isoform X14 n=1 Tax=Haliotis rubra TaxID=36100 RepID=UPI001EE633C7|nr:zinc finger protein 462-like isoform X14 [Haliotis rubra]
MFIETLEFTIPVDLCDLFSTLKRGPRSNLEFPASVNSYGTTQDASVQVVLRSNKLTFKVDGVSSDASIISKSESKTLKLSVFDVDRTLMPQENDNYISNNMTISEIQHSTPVSNQFKRHHEVSVSQPHAKSRRTSFSESPRPKSPFHRRLHPHTSPRQSPSIQSKSQNDTPVNVKQEPEDPDLIEIEPDDIVPKKETPYMQIDYSSDVPHTQTSQAALERLSHPQSSHSQSPGSSSSSFHQNVPHVPDYAEPSTSQARYGDQSADDFLVFQDENDDGDENEADYSNDDVHGLAQETIQGANRSELRQTEAAKKCFHCPKCTKVFAFSSARQRHINAIHENLVYTCVCGKQYNYQQSYGRHRKTCSLASNPYTNFSMSNIPALQKK